MSVIGRENCWKFGRGGGGRCIGFLRRGLSLAPVKLCFFEFGLVCARALLRSSLGLFAWADGNMSLFYFVPTTDLRLIVKVRHFMG